MNAIRYFVTSETNHLEIPLPDDLVQTELEVIILADKSLTKREKYKSLMGSIPKDEAKKMLLEINF